jgi:6-pyruvoyltetrahydropterin/6-carboxytetrahydropterin synthase
VRVKIRHNMEMAHRLLNDDGKCRNIHGHGMQVEMVLLVEEGPDGMAVDNHGDKLEFGALKKALRNHIDSTYDHRLVLNREDPWAQPIYFHGEEWENGEQKFLPGLSLVDGDPTVENLAKWLAKWGAEEFHVDTICRIDETKTNGAEAMFHWNGFGASFVKGAR